MPRLSACITVEMITCAHARHAGETWTMHTFVSVARVLAKQNRPLARSWNPEPAGGNRQGRTCLRALLQLQREPAVRLNLQFGTVPRHTGTQAGAVDGPVDGPPPRPHVPCVTGHRNTVADWTPSVLGLSGGTCPSGNTALAMLKPHMLRVCCVVCMIVLVSSLASQLREIHVHPHAVWLRQPDSPWGSCGMHAETYDASSTGVRCCI